MPKVTRSFATILIVAALVLGSGYVGLKVGRLDAINTLCCQVPRYRRIVLDVKEMLGLVTFPSQIGQDKWVSEGVFPGVTDGFFLDVGSADGIEGSNTFVIEQKGWKGICIDPFPTHMDRRTCQLFKEVVYSEAGKRMTFQVAGGLGGLVDTLGSRKQEAEQAATVEFTTVTLGDILARAKAPRFIHFMSLDIEGAELEALRGLPFDQYEFGALAIEHNYDGQKREGLKTLLESHGYVRVNTWYQDDFYVRRTPRPSR